MPGSVQAGGERPRRLANGLRALGCRYPRDLAVALQALRGRRLRRVPVLTYHRLSDPTGRARSDRLSVAPRLFARQLDWLVERGYRTVFASDLVEALCSGGPLPRKPVVLTFDDGFAGVREHALPLLEKHGLVASVFLITDRVRARREGYLDLESVATLAASGRVEFGSHGRTHRRLPALDPQERERELVESKRCLEDLLGRQTSLFCYPFGASDRESRAAVRRAGYRGAFGSRRGLLHGQGSLFSLSRIPVRHEPCERFAARLRGLRRPAWTL